MAAHAEIIGWAAGVLEENSLDTTVVAETPYSSVIRIDLGGKPVYLKQTPPDLFIEADVIATLREQCGFAAIPEIIAADPSLNGFLMKSCGDVSLRRVYGGNTERADVRPDIDLVVRALAIYREMQRATMLHIDAFIALGVPDWRLQNIPQMYRALANDVAALQVYGLDDEQIAALRMLDGAVAAKCEALAAFGIDECLNHADLHDDNMLLDTTTQAITLIDLGEMTVDHPFLSLAKTLEWFRRGYKLDIQSQDYRRLYDACFKGWEIEGADLNTAIGIAEDLALVYWVFAQRRLVAAAGREVFTGAERTNDPIKATLLLFIERMNRS